MALDLIMSERNDRGVVLARWFGDYHIAIHRYLVRLVGDHERAADLLQDTFVRALAALDADALPNEPGAWLHRIATNVAYDALRRQRRWQWFPLRTEQRAASFEGGVATADIVWRCLARLKPNEAEALLLHEHAGLSCVEIAALGGEDVGAVRMRIHRARVRFRELYGKETGHEV